MFKSSKITDLPINKLKYFPLLVFIFVNIISCYKEELVLIPETKEDLKLESLIYFNSKPCFFDEETSSLTYSLSEIDLENFSPIINFSPLVKVYYEGNLLENSKNLEFKNIEYKKDYSFCFVTNTDSVEIKLRFTALPIVRISKTLNIFDDPKIPAFIHISYPEVSKPDYLGYVGIEYRGASSQIYPKKSFGFNSLANKDIKTYKNTKLVGERENYKWILDAAYIDDLRLRNSVSFSIWSKISDSKNHFSINTMPVELFINNKHQGLYCLNENFSDEILGLKTNSEVLYKAKDWHDGATRFEYANEKVPKTDYWDGWEQKYPNPKSLINWEELKKLRNFIVNSKDKNFIDSIDYYIDIDNFIDYYLFLNLCSAFDNTGKNIFLMKSRETKKFIILPWDLDASWGLFWDRSYIEPTGILSNNLYDRLFELNPNNFKAKVKTRWFDLAQNVFSEEEILDEFEKSINPIIKSGIIDKENLIWSLNIDTEAEYEYLKNWLRARINYLDTYFSSLN
ncbi:MAG: CotH kinase family protein [Bacteroidales bacterium]|jgi:hypothetical protein|nr:CotH kinase family protein [Bacteroidales bacterium]MCK9497903.1 CotH kinase family protein [Bacteroidales bacterium]MDY0313903.1 CotH kinase family protein [Bacteroidales bacterium]